MVKHLNRPKWPFPQHGKLTAHPRRHWCKWLDGASRYFGPWRDPDPGQEFANAALRRYLAYVRANEEKRPAQIDPNDLTVNIAANHDLPARQRDMDAGNLSPGQFVRYKEVAGLLIGPR
jgi:hypothetical protein